MKKDLRFLPVLLASLLIIVQSACNQPGLPAATDELPAELPTTRPTDLPLPSVTPAPTQTASPTASPTNLPTPTVPPEWFIPGQALLESDYFYYDNLLLVKDDRTASALVSGSSGLSMTACDTCDLAAMHFLYVTHLASSTQVTLGVLLYRHTSLETARAALEKHINESLALGNTLGQAPADLPLPAGTTVLVQGSAVAVMTLYEAFEIQLMQAQPNTLSLEESIRLFTELTQLQVKKLQDAGY